MLSLKKTIRGLEREEARFRAALGCYLFSLSAIQEQLAGGSADEDCELRRQLQAIGEQVASDPGVGSLEESRTTLQNSLRRYKDAMDSNLARKEEDLREIIGILCSAADTLSECNESHTARLKDFSSEFQVVARGSDLGRVRVELTKKVSEFRAATESMWRENQSSVSAMQSQLSDFQMRLERAESRATIDALTGLLNRGEGEIRLRRALEGESLVSIILFDLDGFKQVNDRWGHSAGDQVLKIFAHTLSQNVRTSDTVCRWGGDEFLLVLKGSEQVARDRGSQLRTRLQTRHRIVLLGNLVDLEVKASLGVAQALPGESMEDMLTRADVELYRHKVVARGQREVSPFPIGKVNK